MLKNFIIFLSNQCNFLINIFNDLDKFNKLKRPKEKKTSLNDTALELANDLLQIYFYKYKALSNVKKVVW